MEDTCSAVGTCRDDLNTKDQLIPKFDAANYCVFGAMLVISVLVVIYYNMIIAWTLYYTFAGFTVTRQKYWGNRTRGRSSLQADGR